MIRDREYLPPFLAVLFREELQIRFKVAISNRFVALNLHFLGGCGGGGGGV